MTTFVFKEKKFMESLQGITVSRETIEKLEMYERLLLKWQKTINLVGESTLSDIWQRHFLDSAQLIKYFPPKGKRIIDFGSGAGFPVLVYAVLLQATESGRNLQIHAIESDARKCAFMREVIRNLNLNVTLHNARIEQLSLGSFDVITARALSSLSGLLTYARPFITNESTCIFLKGRNVADELTLFKKKWQGEITEEPSLSDQEGRIVIIKNIREL